MKKCKICGEVQPFSEFSKAATKDGMRNECLKCRREADRVRRANLKAAGKQRPSQTYEYKRRERLKRVFSITTEDYDAMFSAQGGVCAICSNPQTWSRRDIDVLCVDHDHTTGAVRGLLCHDCNIMLSNAKDDITILLSAVEYLKKIC